MILIAVVPCHCFSLILGSFSFWSIKALSELKEEHNDAEVY